LRSCKGCQFHARQNTPRSVCALDHSPVTP
jgi:hypothetical protein